MIRKTLLISTLLIIFCMASVKSQDRDKRGYVGVSIGPSFLIGYDHMGNKAGTGLNINLINFSYRIANRFGVSLVWMGGAHIFDSSTQVWDGVNYYDIPMEINLSYGAIMIGPMYSVKQSDNSSLEFKPRIGLFYVREEMSSEGSMNGWTMDGREETRSFGYSFAVTYRKAFAEHWCVTISGDYYSGKYSSFGSSQTRLAPLTLTAGIGFQF